jgi:hypothetical protein
MKQPPDTRDPALARAQAEVIESRAQVARSVAELQVEIGRALDWRQWIQRRPIMAMGLAFGLGFLLGRRD